MHDFKSFRPDVFRATPAVLFASLCDACGAKCFPPRESCPHCGSGADPRTVELGTTGRIYSVTTVRQAPPDLPTPYLLAYVDLPDDGVRILSRIEGFDEAPAIGTPVALVASDIDRTGTDELKFAFRPAPQVGKDA